MYDVQGEFTDGVSETAVGPIFTFAFLLITSEDGPHSGFRNIVGKFTSHIVQKPPNQKTTSISW